MANWLELGPAILVALVVLWGPGYVLTRALGVQGFTSFAWAPAASVGIIATSAVLASKLGVSWGLLPVVGLTILCASILLVARLWLTRLEIWGAGEPNEILPYLQSIRRDLPAFGGVAAASLLLTWRLAEGIGRPDNFSQTYDNNFHLNAVRWILDTGDASSLNLTEMTSGGGPGGFYPAAFHGVVSLVGTVVPMSIPALVNSVVLVVGAVVWPMSILALTGLFISLKSWAIVPATAGLAGFSTFPYLLVDFGVLYPNFFGYALAPAVLAVIGVALRAGSTTDRPLAALLIALPMAVGLGLAHPSAAMMLVALALPMLVLVVVRVVRAGISAARAKDRSRLIRQGLLAAVLVLCSVFVIPLLWLKINPGFDPRFWLPYQTPPQAIGEALLATGMERPGSLLLSAAAITGGMLIARRRGRDAWFLGSVAIVGLLWVTISAVTPGWLRDTLTSVWYNDPNRIASALPIVIAPLVVLGVVVAVSGFQAFAKRRLSKQLTGVALSAGLVIFILGTQGSAVSAAVESMRESYGFSDDSALVSSDEFELIASLGDLLPDDSHVAVNPFTGGALAYALADVDTTSRHTLGVISSDQELINDELRDATAGSEVCQAVLREKLTHVLDFGRREVHGGDSGFHGISDLTGSPAVSLVAEVGEARLWEITAC